MVSGTTQLPHIENNRLSCLCATPKQVIGRTVGPFFTRPGPDALSYFASIRRPLNSAHVFVPLSTPLLLSRTT